ncbi:hypothetical protein B0H13DRAFT_2316179 [Mycena leptocephala]|nr:hypothetical protein B0H13DRAFT_2316179 [Mycena leptocephala]
MHAPIPRGTVVYMGNARLPARIETSGKAVEKTALSRLWYVMEKQGDRYLLSAIFLSLVVGFTRARKISERYQAEIRSIQTCGGSTDALPFYRMFNPTTVDHVYTTDWVVVNADVPTLNFQGVAALVFDTQEESTVPFYRLVNRATSVNFYTISETERADALQNGYTAPPNNPVTYIYPTQICGSVPFYRLYQAVETTISIPPRNRRGWNLLPRDTPTSDRRICVTGDVHSVRLTRIIQI